MPERYARVREVFLAARRKDPPARARLLEEACAGDPELRAEVESLLEHAEQAASFLETPVLSPGIYQERVPNLAPLECLQRIGRYRILSLLGEGGMGVVYRAEQESPRRTVALKLILPGLASPSRLRRFEHEAELLGRLHHPGIAQIFEAGTAEAGAGLQPFFAMELVQGEPITAWAEARRLSTRQRLELFARVCDAVEHAHRHGVVHRDLKPANVLVDESGQPKVLDFGVARATGGDVQLTTLRTGLGQILGTLPYMSPEQARGNPREIDARSDVYALGVLLYELLVGRLPHDVTGRPILEAARLLVEEEPTPISAFGRYLRGDLETIVGKALEKEKTRRYVSAADLASDLRCHLSDRPIAARPPSRVYRVRKFARRHKMLVAAIAALAVGAAGTTWQAVRATRQRDAALSAGKLADRRRAEAEAEARKALEIQRFLEDMLASVDPEQARGRDASLLREMLDRASLRIGSELGSEPEVQSALELTIGTVYSSLGLFDQAAPHLRRSFETRARVLGPEHADTLRSGTDLVIALRESGRLEEAEAVGREALGHSLRAFGPEDERTLLLQEYLAISLAALGRRGEAASMLEPVLAAFERLYGPGHEHTLGSMNNLAFLELERGHLSRAEELFRRAADGMALRAGEDHPRTLAARMNLALALSSQRRFTEAEPIYRAVLESQRHVLPAGHPQLVSTLSSLAQVFVDLGRLDEAEPLEREAWESVSAAHGEGHPLARHTLRLLADLLVRMRCWDEAERLTQRALDLCREHDGPAHAETLQAMLSRVACLARQGRLEEAEPVISELMSAVDTGQAPEDPAALSIRRDLCRLLVRLRRFEEAEPILLACYARCNELYGPEHPDTHGTCGDLAHLYQEWGKPDCEAIYRQASGER